MSTGFFAFGKDSQSGPQNHWESFVKATGADVNDVNLWFHGTAVISTLVYWLVGALYLYMDLTGRPQFMRKYKIQPGANAPLDRNKLKPVLLVVLFNQFVVGAMMALIFLKILKWRGHQDTNVLPPLYRIVLEFLFCMLTYETLFYYSHRMLHRGKLYRWIHKKHHEWTAPLAITAIYCHPIEHALGNLVPVLTGALICGSHVVTFWIWLIFVTLLTLNDHSDYHLPFAFSSEMHDYHHYK